MLLLTRFSDAQLVAAVRSGELQAFAELVHRYRDLHARYVLRLLGNRDDAEDVLQGAFLRAFRHLASCHDPDRFGAWLHRIVVNECRTALAKRALERRRLLDDDSALAFVPDRHPEGDVALRAAIDRALDRLTPESREAFVMKHVEDMPYEEIAALTGDSVSALKMRVKRACDQLRAELEPVIRT